MKRESFHRISRRWATPLPVGFLLFLLRGLLFRSGLEESKSDGGRPAAGGHPFLLP